MKSVAAFHFPRVFVDEGRKWLFNPVLRKRYKNRPEERVRLKWVEYLLHETRWKRTRIGFETPVKPRNAEHDLRTDLLLYSDNMKPHILVECKSPSVKLTTSAAEQAARYNSKIGAGYIILTNGRTDFCYHLNDGITEISELPFQEKGTSKQRDFSYWAGRGFGSVKSSDTLKTWLIPALNDFWFDGFDGQAGQPQYLPFGESYLPVPMEQDYRVFDMGNQTRLAISFIGYENSESYLVAVLNQNGSNRGVLTVNLDDLAGEKKQSARCYTPEKETVIDARKLLDFDFGAYQTDTVKKLPGLLMRFFD